MNRVYHFCLPILTCALLSVTAASAQRPDAEEGVEIIRDAIELRGILETRPLDLDITDSVLVFTNTGPVPVRIDCIAFDHNGARVGRAWLRVPKRGLRFVTASDISNNADFIGLSQCSTGGHATKGSAFLLGPDGVTNLPVEQVSIGGRLHIQVPVTATY